jgi:hypothetical protein
MHIVQITATILIQGIRKTSFYQISDCIQILAHVEWSQLTGRLIEGTGDCAHNPIESIHFTPSCLLGV